MYELLVRPIEGPDRGIYGTGCRRYRRRGVRSQKACRAARLRQPARGQLYAHANVQTEWWYYTGHCETASGRRFGFELVFFKRRTGLDRLGFLPLRLVANPMYAAHFAITDIDGERFTYDHRRSLGGAFDLAVKACEDRYELGLGDWSVKEENGKHLLRASLGKDLTFSAVLENTKPPVLNGHEGIGISHRELGERSCHFSFTRMSVEGETTLRGEKESFTGSAWMHREFGTWSQKNWDWLSIQLDGGDELMIYQFRNAEGGAGEFSHGAYIDSDGESTYLKLEDFTVEPTGTWKSLKTGAEYPSGWRVTVPQLGCELAVEPVLRDQELDTRGTTMIVYWEGACGVSGTCAGREVTGRAYAELVGYERSHENPSLSTFLFDGSLVRRLFES